LIYLQYLKKERRKKVTFNMISDLIFISINQSIMMIIILDASGPLVVDSHFFHFFFIFILFFWL